MVRPGGTGGGLVRSVVTGLLLVTLAGCSGTEPTPPGPSQAFAGTIFGSRSRNPMGGGGVLAPLGFHASGREYLMPIDLTRFWDGTWEEDFWRGVIGQDYDVSRDGQYLYTSVTNYIVRFTLPEGSAPEVLATIGPTKDIRLSPNGEWLVFREAVAPGRVFLMPAEVGGEVRVILPPTGQPGVGYLPPVWLTDEHLMVPVTRSALEPPYGWVLELKAPNWMPQEYEPFRLDEVPRRLDLNTLAASPAGDRLYIISRTGPQPVLLEYPVGRFTGDVKVIFPQDVGWDVVISPDGRLVATDMYGRVTVHEIATGKEVARLGRPDEETMRASAWVEREYP